MYTHLKCEFQDDHQAEVEGFEQPIITQTLEIIIVVT